ncbi:MAG: OsmC family protein [Acidiferrobacteraceae bacterium]|jgi:putative redox protein|nr:OsmC family protein [Acidiferrobacteraceae bacterium]MBT4396334.1 OsmC family protein [Acidiferrobacteraceae bacterium]MBT4405929.1 OsmC family protein [Acidiferrobacteraceae bacterium]MBT7354274.1 OsmC family protein [Acidiferrobacteraceae bacterium]
MQATVRLKEDDSLEGLTESGHQVVMDRSPDVGGQNLGSRPMEMLLLGLGGCAMIDVVLILRKARQAFTDIRVEINAERASEVPKVFTRIHLHFVVAGKQLDPRRVDRAISLSAQKYCSATKMLDSVAQITHDFEILSG